MVYPIQDAKAKTIPYSAERPRIVNIREYPPPPEFTFTSSDNSSLWCKNGRVDTTQYIALIMYSLRSWFHLSFDHLWRNFDCPLQYRPIENWLRFVNFSLLHRIKNWQNVILPALARRSCDSLVKADSRTFSCFRCPWIGLWHLSTLTQSKSSFLSILEPHGPLTAIRGNKISYKSWCDSYGKLSFKAKTTNNTVVTCLQLMTNVLQPDKVCLFWAKSENRPGFASSLCNHHP